MKFSVDGKTRVNPKQGDRAPNNLFVRVEDVVNANITVDATTVDEISEQLYGEWGGWFIWYVVSNHYEDSARR